MRMQQVIAGKNYKEISANPPYPRFQRSIGGVFIMNADYKPPYAQ
jgi:hypothetical protein